MKRLIVELAAIAGVIVYMRDRHLLVEEQLCRRITLLSRDLATAKRSAAHAETVERSHANVWACAYNAAVNHGSERGHKKMWGLIEALNHDMRATGRAKLQRLVDRGVITSFSPCPPGCAMRPGGLFHVEGCENGMNHDVYRARVRAATEKLPGGPDGFQAWRDATVSLVGREGNGY